MHYEISKEIFKQRLENKLNFMIVDVNPHKSNEASFEGTIQIPAGSEDFVALFEKECPDKARNVLLFSLHDSDNTPQRAAEQLKQAGYHFVYYYCGSPNDIVLDKGMN